MKKFIITTPRAARQGRPAIVSFLAYRLLLALLLALPGLAWAQTPTVSSFSPTNGVPGATITLTGTNFTTATGVRFGGVLVNKLTVASATSMTAVVPVGAVTGTVAVTRATGTGTSSTSFTVTPAQPDIAVAVTPAGPLSACAGPTLTAAATVRAFVPTGTGLDNGVYAVTMQTDGKTLVGGFFTSYNGTARPYVARLNADGSLDTSFAPTGTGLSDFVYSIAVQSDGKILVGGGFISYNGIPRSGVARLNADGSLDTSFALTGTGLNGNVNSLAVQADGKVVIGGDFNSYNGTARPYAARLNADGSLDTSFAPTGTGLNNAVFTLALQADGKVVVGGQFTSYNGTTRNRVARLTATGSLDTSFAPVGTGLNSGVLSVAVQADGKVLVVGFFTSYNGTARNYVARLNADGTLDASFAPTGTGLDDTAYIVATQPDGKVLVGGNFTSYNGTARPYLVRLTATGSLDTSFAPVGTGLDTNVNAVAVQADGKVVIGGDFNSYNGTTRNDVARLNADGSLDATATAASGATYAWSPGGSTGATVVPGPAGGSYQATATVSGYAFLSNTVSVTSCVLITSFSPTSGPAGTSVTLTGTGLTGATAVTVNGAAATAVTVVSSTTVTFVVPAGASNTQSITVTTPGGTSAANTSFTVLLNVASTSPGTNARTAPVASSAVALTFTEPVTVGSIAPTTTAGIKVYSAQVGGRKAGSFTGGGTATVAYTSSLGAAVKDFRAGEVVSVSVPATVLGAGGLAASKKVYQFTTATSGTGRGYFGTGPITVGVSGSSHAVAPADVDGDGDLDLLVTSGTSPGGVNIRLNNGSAAFTSVGTTDAVVGNNPYGIAVGDVDGDGDPDFVTANTSSNTLSIRTNTGGVFGGSQELTVGAGTISVALGDVDGDGDLDVLGTGGTSVSVFLNGSSSSGSNTGVFPTTASSTVAIGGLYSLTLADVNGDGYLDLGTANLNTTGSTVSIRLNNGAGGFAGSTDYTTITTPTGLAFGDIDNDGDLDLVAACQNSGSGGVTVYRNGGDASGSNTGVFGSRTDVSLACRPYHLALGDVDADGDLDLVTANASSATGIPALANTMSVRINDGTGTFGGGSDYAMGSNPRWLALGDLDGDGDLDVMTDDAGASTVSVRLNLPPVPTLATAAPNPGGLGQSITLSGTGLSSPTALSINGASALAAIISNTGSSLVVRVPNTATASGTISLTTASGTSNALPFAVMPAPGNALAFDGSNDFVSVPHNAAFNITAAITLEAWVRTSVTGEKYITTKTENSWYLAMEGGGGAAGVASFWLNGPSPVSGGWLYGTTNLADGRWHHVAGTYDGATLKLYVDGVLENSRAAVAAITTGSSPVLFGSRPGYTPWNGSLDELRIYNAALSAAQVQADMVSTASALPANLVVYFNLDQGTPATAGTGANAGLTTAYDLVSGYAGTLTNFALTSGTTTSNWVESYALVRPTATAATGPTATGFTATWTAPALTSATVDNYLLDVSTVGTFASGVTTYSVAYPTLTKALTGLASGTTYYYQVRADKASVTGQGSPSNVISVPLPSNVSSLSNLVLSAGAISPAFASATTGYTLSTAAASTTVTPTRTQANATITVNGTAVASGTASGSIALNPGANTITVVVTAQDGTTQTTYTVTVTRTCVVTAVAQNVSVPLDAGGNATITGAAVNNGSTATCGFASGGGLSVSPSSFTCANAGPNAVTLTVTDANGNQSTAPATVTVTVPALTTTTWSGAASTDWTNCANWSYGQVPTSAISAVLPAGMPRYPGLPTGSYPVNSLTLASGTSLTTASGATLLVSGDWANNGGTATLGGDVAFTGTAAQAIGGSVATAFGAVTVSKASGSLSLARDLAIGTSLTLTSGTLTTTATYKVALAGTATVSETEASYVLGNVETTRPLSTAGTGSSFGGIGVTLTPAAGSTALPGATLVRRTTGSPATGVSSSTSIGRYFVITPTVDAGLNVTLALTYFDHELNGIAKNQLKLFKSENGTAGPWARVDFATYTPSTNTVTRAAIASLSTWTLGNANAPLPVELLAFTAGKQGPAVALAWRTASEKNSDRFEVERSRDGKVFERIGTVAAQGTSTAPTAYSFLDSKYPGETNMLYYRLRQVDTDGSASYSPVRAVAVGKVVFPLFYPNPTHSAFAVSGMAAGTTLEVFDAVGRVVITATADADGTARLTLPTGLAPGVYVVRCGTQVQRFAVE